jgi:hypothetical protein
MRVLLSVNHSDPRLCALNASQNINLRTHILRMEELLCLQYQSFHMNQICSVIIAFFQKGISLIGHVINSVLVH